MNNHISSNPKFVAIALDDATSHLTDFVDVDKGVFFCPRAPFQVDPQWRKWIGTLRASEFEQANLVLLASRLSGKPQILDDENQELGKDLESLESGKGHGKGQVLQCNIAEANGGKEKERKSV